ncbi:probable ATP-dependent DNA helicase HFM1 [Teleopsis dalmanni]|uniref:probable ATP-dependent DNA helicase HFM1 n=1 Tax=Teleopsis dalmanni TaxID=139649 RepID=UPI0018CDE1D7|nr:probable ATP-dependent DNA helicase HFM1 [Teleopsis dalmanni]XP_037932918.1 probable ATP-dependent DNA helicase HFM1 [Teleopsis dalmanni]
MNGKKFVESHFHKYLTEHLNAEIALNTIQNFDIAMNWIRSTFFYVRAVRNPSSKYELQPRMDKDLIDRKIEEMCLRQIKELQKNGLVILNGMNLQTTVYGKLMSKYYLSFETMKLFRQIKGSETYLETINTIVKCKEFSDFVIRANEKGILNQLNGSPIRFPIRGRIRSNEDKISCLIQAVFGNLTLPTPALIQESIKIIRIGDRLSKCLLEYLRLRQSNDSKFRCYKALLNALTIVKCFHAKLWENSEFASKQIRKIGAVHSSLLVNAGKTTIKSISETDARTIESILNLSAPFGNELLLNIMITYPTYLLDISLKSENVIQVHLKQLNEEYIYIGSHTVLIVGDSLNNLLLYEENV